MTLRVLVLGCGDVGSAVAHRLFLHGADVVLADVEAPAHPRRGMAFVDAWFTGTATLECVATQMVPDVGGLASTLEAMDAIAGTCASPMATAAAFRPDALVDARMLKRAVPEDVRTLAPRTVGLGPGFAPGLNCTVAIETAWGDGLGEVLHDAPASPLAGEPRVLGGAGRERFVYAGQAGLWRTAAHIGDHVSDGAVIGELAGEAVRAPLTGLLRGLTHDGVAVHARQKIVEVDPSAEPDAHGLGARPSALARGVARALGLPTGLDEAFFGFEREFKRTLDCMPMSMRLKLDRCGLKLSLEQWRALPLPLRETLLEMSVDTARQADRLAGLLRRRQQQLGWSELPRVRVEDGVWHTVDAVPHAVAERCFDMSLSAPSADHWSALTLLQRYALAKLATNRSGRNWREALDEFLANSA
ncbi:MAG: hypothetical protein HYX46_06755 [Betaproteobacteria bacterium]|nr:hypothetical protein [Betaproteobacteria bacterium]